MELTSKKFNELNTKELYEILKSRAEIFIIEQNIHYLDIDDIDYDSLHCFFMEDNRIVAYLRAFYQNDDKNIVKFGRVLTLKHGMGIGSDLIIQSLQVIKEKLKCKKVIVDAQKHAVGFYEKFGFVSISDDFLEEGVVHVAMELEL